MNRNKKELLELLLEIYKSSVFKNMLKYGINGISLKTTGLCSAILRLRNPKIITPSEHVTLWICLHDNRPKYSIDVYWWPKGKIKPRIEFLQELISEL